MGGPVGRCLTTIYHVLLQNLKMFSVISPFICEAIFLNLKDAFSLKEESISHFNWPKYNQKSINQELESQLTSSKQIIQAALYAREKAKLGLRWPVEEIIIVSSDKSVTNMVKKMQDILRTQINTKSIKVVENLAGVKVKIKPNYQKIGPSFGKNSPEVISELSRMDSSKILDEIDKKGSLNLKIGKEKFTIVKEMLTIEHEVPGFYKEAESKIGFVYLNTRRSENLVSEGFSREIMRQIQNLRKEAGLEKIDRIKLHLVTSSELEKLMLQYSKDIQDKVGADEIIISSSAPTKKFKQQSDFTVKKETFVAYFSKV